MLTSDDQTWRSTLYVHYPRNCHALASREYNETIGCEYHLGVATMAYIISLLAKCIVWERDPPLSFMGYFPRPHTLIRP